MNHKICWLRLQFPWMGKHSGYDLLCSAIAHLPAQNTYYSIWQNPNRPFPKGTTRFVRYCYKRAKPSSMYALDSTAGELKLLWKNWLEKPHLSHICYVENQLGIIPQWRKLFSGKIIGTAHQPSGWWRLTHKYPETIAALDGLIVVSKSRSSSTTSFPLFR